MALVDCPECKKEVSEKAPTCPNCGAPIAQLAEKPEKKEKKKPKQYGCGTLILVIIVGGFLFSLASPDKPKKPKKPKTAAELRTEKLSACFSNWNGAHRNLEKIVKKSMNDPDSYEHDETRYTDNGDHLIVRTTFRGTNAFGGTVKNSVRAKTDLECNVVEVIE